MAPDAPNLICIVSDTLRTAYLGCYGNPDIHTPNLDTFARQSVVCDRAYPESLPTIPVRRALHTGRRAYPFASYQPIPWDIVYLPGWQPMDPAEPTLAGDLAGAGYHTGFVTDTLPYFQPGMNFARGFWQWEYIRGLQQDRWQSPATPTDAELARYGDPAEIRRARQKSTVLRHVANTRDMRRAGETTTDRMYRWAEQFVRDNRDYGPFYLLVDGFAPHEPWDAPEQYLRLYADPDYTEPTIVHTAYRTVDGYLDEAQVAHIVAHYCGLVTLVDAAFGRFMNALDELKLLDDSLIVFLSDHGTNFAWDNPEHIIGKPHQALYPGVMDLPLLVRFPQGQGAGQRRDELVYNLDVTATLYDYANVTPAPVDGQSLRRLLTSEWQPRAYVTSRYNETLWYRDERYWAILTTAGEALAVFDLPTDPKCMHNLADQSPKVVALAWERLLADAGGEIPVYSGERTDAIGQRPAGR